MKNEKHWYADIGLSADEFRANANRLLEGKWKGATDIEWLLNGRGGTHMVRFHLPAPKGA